MANKRKFAVEAETIAVQHGKNTRTKHLEKCQLNGDNAQPQQRAKKQRTVVTAVDKPETVPTHMKSTKPEQVSLPAAAKAAGESRLPTAEPKASTRKTKRAREEDCVTPQAKRFKDVRPPTPTETPTRRTLALFDGLKLGGCDKASLQLKAAAPLLDTPPLTPDADDHLPLAFVSEDLPESLVAFVRLFSSSLRAISLFHVHHGVGTPLYLSTLLPLITHTWKRRRVTERDIRQMVAIFEPSNIFRLLDNGEGNISIELEGAGVSRTGQVNQERLNGRFESRIKEMWEEWTSQRPPHLLDPSAFLESLPLAKVLKSEVAAESSKLTQDRDRLNRFKRGAVEARADDKAATRPNVPQEAKTAAAVSSRGSNLLDRIMAKQQILSNRPSGPTQEELDRKAALHRIEEIVLVLDLLAGGRPRASFSAQTMFQHLQTSLRNPISREEVDKCMDLMAKEVTPSFLSLINTGSVRGVVVTKGGRLSSADLRRSLERAGA